MAGKYVIYIDDNFDFMDEDARSYFGSFDTRALAAKAMKLIIDGDLIKWACKYSTAEELLKHYKSFGDDPFCPGLDFSAWTWAEGRCKELVSMTPEELEIEKARHDREWEKMLELRRND